VKVLPTAQVLSPGIFSTLQDSGRFGYMRYGIPVSGAMDQESFSAANRALGNRSNSPCLEVLGGNLILKFRAPAWVSVTGAENSVFVDYEPSSLGEPFFVGEGKKLLLGFPSVGFVNYVGVSGGWEGELILGSRSTYTPGGFGGSWGRALRVGDILSSKTQPRSSPERKLGRRLPVHRIPVLRGPHWGLVERAGISEFFQREFIISAESDRVGYRLVGEDIPVFRQEGELASFPVFPGMIQLPEGGRPVVIMKDGPTTGGYPVIGLMDFKAIGELAQIGPGGSVRFQLIE
jgi:biotin-dependent carboxylase-like uncharacterized protein